MEVGEVPKGIRWSAKAGGPPKVRIGGVSGRGRGPIIKGAFYCGTPASAADPTYSDFWWTPGPWPTTLSPSGPPPLPWLASNLGPRA